MAELHAKGIILGIFDEVSLEEESLQLEPGDFLLLYTDGVTDASDENGELFGKHRLMELLKEQHWETAEEAANAILTAVQNFVGDTPQTDDLTLLVLHRLPQS